MNFLLTIIISYYYFSGTWKFRNLPLQKRWIYPTLTSFSVLPFLSLSMAKSVYVATTWQWSFHLISITTPDWTGLWISSHNLPLLHQINWFYAANLTDLQKRKTTSKYYKRASGRQASNFIEETPPLWCFRGPISLAFEAFYTRTRSSHAKALIYFKSLKTVCEEVNL